MEAVGKLSLISMEIPFEYKVSTSLESHFDRCLSIVELSFVRASRRGSALPKPKAYMACHYMPHQTPLNISLDLRVEVSNELDCESTGGLVAPAESFVSQSTHPAASWTRKKRHQQG